ncbi:ABC transporter substrate-binding protein [Micromonospora sp. NPDC023737]|uniref:ABC transporter substrate-binding protein n=1 Tax=unclassified Micromonospora TaxID=2617518 RepID=UPI0033F58C56
MRLAVPDLISNSYFPAVAAVELGLMREEGLDVTLELLFPVTDAAAALRDGEIDFLAGAAHAPLYDVRAWDDTTLVAALSNNMYWYLVVAADSHVDAGSWTSLRDVRIGAAPGPDTGLRQLLIGAGLDLEEARIDIAPVPGADAPSVSFGVTAAQALEQGRIDAFWANGMGAEVAVRDGIGKVIFDARRCDGEAAGFTFPALMTSRRLAAESPEVVSAAVRAIVRAQRALREDPSLAEKVADGLFPPMETGLIANLVRRDLPFYNSAINDSAVASLQDFARRAALPGAGGSFARAVAREFAPLWSS